MTREYTRRLLEMIEEGALDRDTVINACVNVMSESDVQSMCEDEGFFSLDEGEEDDSDEEGGES